MSKSKVKQFIAAYLSPTGHSAVIPRYSLPPGLAYTSGDGIFRSDGTLGFAYRFFRYSPTLDFKKKSMCWTLTPDDEKILTDQHQTLTFPSKSGPTVHYIQFFGKVDNPLTEDPPRDDLKKIICKMPCVHCGTTKDIQCDHKNDLKNDPRVLNKTTQKLEDFQALCRHCNDVKRAVKRRMTETGKRYSAVALGYAVDFTQGDETLDETDPYWYVGTYWGDCAAFKRSLIKKTNII